MWSIIGLLIIIIIFFSIVSIFVVLDNIACFYKDKIELNSISEQIDNEKAFIEKYKSDFYAELTDKFKTYEKELHSESINFTSIDSKFISSLNTYEDRIHSAYKRILYLQNEKLRLFNQIELFITAPGISKHFVR